ncbi:hypothetical protein RSW80_26100, partial [Escherichia coli]|uniref:LysR substrate-binding domain-containing protein n=2 Tax=Pseudomonadota TaxID=1224 RepID=UPI0028E02654|nr:hypothetical protein [Escherichia coli]
ELAGHDWLGLPPRSGAATALAFQGPQGARAEVRVEPRVLASQVTVLEALALEGWGLYVGMRDDVGAALDQGRLVPVLPDWRLEPAAVFA